MKLTDLRGILQYIPQFREKTFILAIDGDIVTDDNFATLLLDVALLWSLNIRVVLVHGASEQIRSLAEERKVDGVGSRRRRGHRRGDARPGADRRHAADARDSRGPVGQRPARRVHQRDHRASGRHHPGRRPPVHRQGRACRRRAAAVAALAGRRAGDSAARLRRRRQDLSRELGWRRRGGGRAAEGDQADLRDVAGRADLPRQLIRQMLVDELGELVQQDPAGFAPTDAARRRSTRRRPATPVCRACT